MKVAVTGAAGYLGRSVLRFLSEDPSITSVLGLDIVPPKFTHPKFSFQHADVRTADFKEIFSGFDAVCHLAFIVQPPRKMPMNVIDEINVTGSRRVFEGAIDAGVERIVCASSVAAYGVRPDNPEVLTEDSPLRPNENWYYSRTKGRVEALLDDLQERHPNTTVIRLRPSVFLGPGIDNSLGRQFAAPFLVCFDRNMKLDLCWVEDVAEAFRLALHHRGSDAFNLAGDAPLTMEELGRLTGKRVLQLRRGLVLSILRTARTLRLVGDGELEWLKVAAVHPLLVSSKKAKEKLGWKPRYDAAGTLLEFIRQRRLLNT